MRGSSRARRSFGTSQACIQRIENSFGTGQQRVVVREVSLPWLPEKELRDSLGFQVQEFIPMAADEAVLAADEATPSARAGAAATTTVATMTAWAIKRFMQGLLTWRFDTRQRG